MICALVHTCARPGGSLEAVQTCPPIQWFSLRLPFAGTFFLHRETTEANHESVLQGQILLQYILTTLTVYYVKKTTTAWGQKDINLDGVSLTVSKDNTNGTSVSGVPH